MENIDSFVQKTFTDEPDVLVIQIRKLSDSIQVVKSSLETMGTDKVMHDARVYIRSVHHRIDVPNA